MTKELEKVSLGEGRTELLEHQQRKEYAWYGLMEYISNYEVTTCHSWEKNWIGMNKETRNLFHREDKWKLGSYIIPINSITP